MTKMSRKVIDRQAAAISDVHFKAATPREIDTGLVGWISCTVAGFLRIDGLTVRRTADGRLTLSFPSRRDGAGRQHFYTRPVDYNARRDIEHQVFAALGLEERAS